MMVYVFPISIRTEGELTCIVVDWLTDRLIYFLTDLLTDLLSDWHMVLPTDWLTDWLSD